MTATHQIPSVPDTSGIWGDGALRGTVQLLDEHGDFHHCGRWTRYQLVYSNAPQRLVFQGPVLPAEPRSAVLPLPAVIALHPLQEDPTVTVRAGDLIEFADRRWSLQDGPRGQYPTMTLVAP